MQMSQSIANVAAALCKFQGIVTNPKKDAVNPHFKSKYADLDEIITTIRPALEKCDLAFIQNPVTDEKGNVGVYTLLLHKSGEYIQFDPVFIPLGKTNAHQVGSAMTYARRYSLGAALGIATDDDDDASSGQFPNGNGTKSQTQQPPQRQAKQQTQRPVNQQQQEPKKPIGLATQNQLKRMFAQAKQKHLQDQEIKKIVKFFTKKESSKELTSKEASDLIEFFQNNTEDEIRLTLEVSDFDEATLGGEAQ